MHEFDKGTLLAQAKNLSEFYNEESASLPSRLNLIDQLHPSETAHSRMLCALLSYRKGDSYPLLESFVDFIFSTTTLEDLPNVRAPRCRCEQDRIDLLIEEAGQYAIIIENKIHGALDQPQQIERYVERVIHRGIPQSHIYVLYLTRDGNKEVAAHSLTDRVKQWLEVKDDSFGRFIPINYRDHVLPWLEKLVSLYSTDNMLFTSAIWQYKDHLKGLLMLRDDEKIIFDKMNAKVKEELRLSTLEKMKEVQNGIRLLDDSMSKILDEKIQQIGEECITKPLKKFASKKGCEVKDVSFGNYVFTIRIEPSNWKKCSFIMNCESGHGGILYGIAHYDGQNNSISDDLKKEIKQRMSSSAFNQSQWWPCWKRVEKNFRTPDIDFWIGVRDRHLGIYQYIVTCYKEIYEKTKDLDL